MLAWHAVTGAGVNGSMMRDLMLEAVELRFDTIQTLDAVEWLSDNGSAFTARETLTSLPPSAWCRLHSNAEPGVLRHMVLNVMQKGRHRGIAM
jgi:transposase InsO family protein